MSDQDDDRSLLARSVQWASSVTTIAIEMVLPALLGAWLDGRLGTRGLFAVIGGVVGVAAGIWSLLRLIEPLRRGDKPPKQPSQ